MFELLLGKEGRSLSRRNWVLQRVIIPLKSGINTDGVVDLRSATSVRGPVVRQPVK